MSAAVATLAYRMGDNALILAQQNGKWCGHAPTLEEDIALANIALDLIGQTRFWLGLAAQLEGAGKSADDLAFLRDVHEYRNSYLVEQPNGDYGQTIMRQYLFDLWHEARVVGLVQSSDSSVKEIASKARNEVAYHLKRSRATVQKLADGTEESQARMQQALDYLWPAFGSLFEDAAEDEALAADGIAPTPASLRAGVLAALGADLRPHLELPQSTYYHKGAVRGVHSEHLGHILADMQFLQRAYPGCEW